MAFRVEGTYMESCSCEAICPCIVLSPPTEGECRALVAWQIERGNLDEVKLDGLRIALLLHAPGKMHETKWKVAVYVDDRADDAQKDALLRIFGGKAGGHPAVLASFIGEMVGVKSVPIAFEKNGKTMAVRIPSMVETELEAIEGGGGGETKVVGNPFSVAPGQDLTVARAKTSRITDFGWDWDFEGRQCMYSPFAYEA